MGVFIISSVYSIIIQIITTFFRAINTLIQIIIKLSTASPDKICDFYGTDPAAKNV